MANMKDKTKIRRQFFDSLKRGTGEAFLLAQDNPEIDFSPYIIKGIVKNYAYDGQSEGDRAQYIYDLISLSKKKGEIRKAVLRGLAAERKDTWTLTHLFALAKIYAQKGDDELRQAIYDRFLYNPIDGSDWVGYSEILELGGFQGLLYISEKYGTWLGESPDRWVDDHIIKNFQDDNPQIKVLQELDKAARTNPHVKIYLDCIQKTEACRKPNITDIEKYSDIVDEALNIKYFAIRRRRKGLSEFELAQIAKRLLEERSMVNQEKLLAVFCIFKFPFDSSFILRLAKQKFSKKCRISEFATCALKHLKAKNIRNFALKRIMKAQKPNLYADILVSNYENGDSRILTAVARKFKNKDIVECLAASYIAILKSNKTKECKEPLEELYGKMNCGIHRLALVEVLIENDVLSEKLREEIRYDSYPETRELAKR